MKHCFEIPSESDYAMRTSIVADRESRFEWSVPTAWAHFSQSY